MAINTIRLENIKKVYAKNNTIVTIFKDFSFTFRKGMSYAIMGISGAGKSTLLHIIAGLDTPTAGNLYINEIESNALDRAQKNLIYTKHIGFVLQLPYLIGECTAVENIMLKGLIGGLSKEDALHKAYRLLKSVNLEAQADNYPHQLSGGQQQRIAIARALMSDPDFIIADEPTGNLDEQMANQIIVQLLSLCKEYDKGLIISSHSQKIAEKMDEIIYIKPNVIVTV
jgi:lipoprotein-releasing system ATP-binding protein